MGLLAVAVGLVFASLPFALLGVIVAVWTVDELVARLRYDGWRNAFESLLKACKDTENNENLPPWGSHTERLRTKVQSLWISYHVVPGLTSMWKAVEFAEKPTHKGFARFVEKELRKVGSDDDELQQLWLRTGGRRRLFRWF